MTPFDILVMMLSYAVILFLCLPVHELAHALVAHWCGDDTAKWYGRLTLNPFKHLDVWGTVMILTVGFGYARPVPVNSRNFRNYKRDMILVALAGPLSNFLMAAVAMFLLRLVLFLGLSGVALNIAYVILYTAVMVNISLMVFNLLPIPPLDGSRLWSSLLPGRWAYALEQYSQYITIGLMVLIFSNALDVPLAYMRGAVVYLLDILTGWPFLLLK
ncbi:MAG: site-2 protease family protein [Clostridia bacterium]|nr:site-2 protease family protein [Clostridia bacterium]